MARIHTIGLDIGKNVFQVHGIDDQGAVVTRKKLARKDVWSFFAELDPCLVGIEACPGAHHWGSIIRDMGHDVRLMPAAYVQVYAKIHKSDVRDAEAICEAVRRPTMRFVPIKSREQQAVMTVHQVRNLLIRQRTMLINALRAHAAEFGIVMPAGYAGGTALLRFLDTNPDRVLPELALPGLRTIAAAIRKLTTMIAERVAELKAWHASSDQSRRVATIPGIGILTATAIAASTGDPKSFDSGRQFAAWIGLVPRQKSSGGKARLGKITKAGNSYLRKLLYSCATSTLSGRAKTRTRMREWATALRARKPFNVVAIALANKMARVAWALMAKEEEFVGILGQ